MASLSALLTSVWVLPPKPRARHRSDQDPTNWQHTCYVQLPKRAGSYAMHQSDLSLEIINQLPDAVIAIDAQRRVIGWNPAAVRIYGYSSEEALGREIQSLCLSALFPVTNPKIIDAFAREDRWESPLVTILHKSGSELCVALRVFLLRDKSGNISGQVSFSNPVPGDCGRSTAAGISERGFAGPTSPQGVREALLEEMSGRKEAEAALQESRKHLLHLLEHGPAVLYCAKPFGEFAATFVSENVKAFTGFDAERFLAEPAFWLQRVHPEDRERLTEELAAISVGAPSSIEYRFLRRDGAYAWTRDILTILADESGAPAEIVGCWMDISSERVTREAVAARERMQLLAQGLLSSQEEERRRLSRELHDDLNQRLALLLLDIGAVRRDAVNLKLIPRLNEVKRQVADISDALRRIAANMHPARLDKLGIASALEYECTAFQRRYGINAEFTHMTVGQVGGDMALGLYRIAQEALSNVARHARATRVNVRLESVDHRLVLSIADDGQGFDPESADCHRGLGVTSMAERAHLLSGVLEIASRPGKGATITVSVPLSGERHDDPDCSHSG